MKVLVYVPLHPDYGIRKKSLESVMALEWGTRLSIIFGRSAKARPDGHLDLCNKLQEARHIVLDCNYDALLVVEADMVVPRTALIRLSSLDGDVVYGLYCSRRGEHPWLVFTDVDEQEGSILEKKYRPLYFGSAIDSCGVGMGCTLIRRSALLDVPFRTQNGGQAPDWWFALDCKEMGMHQISDMGTVCGHYLNENEIIYPDPTQISLYRTEVE